MPLHPEVDEQTLGLLIDRLRGQMMSDLEAVAFAAGLIRSGRIHGSSQDVFNLLAARLEEITLREESPDVRD